MKQEDKELLLKDLCARLPYNLKVYRKWVAPLSGSPEETIDNFSIFDIEVLSSPYNWCSTEKGLREVRNYEVKPYLYPLSSMTREQKEEVEDKLTFPNKSDGGWIEILYNDKYEIPFWFVDFCNKNHLDFEKSLALDTTGLNIY